MHDAQIRVAIVGAGHLGGKDSVQAFLAKRKIKSARVQ